MVTPLEGGIEDVKGETGRTTERTTVTKLTLFVGNSHSEKLTKKQQKTASQSTTGAQRAHFMHTYSLRSHAPAPPPPPINICH
jgi:hypothetical protein